MKRKELSEIIQKTFPDCIGFMITGSQVINDTFTGLSDIDIVVFDTFYSALTSKVLKSGEIFIDFTIIPVYDIQNIVTYALHDPKKILLSMITNGEILNDTDSIIKSIQKKIAPLLNAPSVSANGRYEILNIELKKIDKYLKRSLLPDDKFILLCEFVNIITSMEVIKKTNWSADHLRKAMLLRGVNNKFVSDISKLFNDAILNGSVKGVTDFISMYQHKPNASIGEPANKFLSVDLSISNFSLNKFKADIYPILITNPILATQFRYWHIFQVRYHSNDRKNISIVFELTDTIKKTEILSIINALFLNAQNEIIIHETINLPPAIDEVIKFRVKICQANLTNISLSDETICRFVIQLGIFLIKELNLSPQDIAQLNEILLQLCLFNKEEQKDTRGYAYLFTLAEAKIEQLSKFYSENIIGLPLVDLEYKPSYYYEAIKSLIFSLIRNGGIERLSPYMPLQLLESLLIEKLDAAIGYFIMIQEIFMLMNLNETQKMQAFWSITEIVTDIH